MNIVVLGGGFRNKGNEAMLRVVQRELGRRIESTNIFAMLDPNEHLQAYASGIVPLSIGNPKLRRHLGSSLSRRLSIWRFLVQRGAIGKLARSISAGRDMENRIVPQMIARIIGGIDAVVDIHGYAFGDPWSLSGFKAAMRWGEYCRLNGKPYCVLPQTWGPFGKDGYATAAASMLGNASLFYAREVPSQMELAKALSKSAEEIPLAPDTVFRFESGPSALGESLLRQIGVDRREKPLIGITPNMRVYERTSGVGALNEYVRLLCHLTDHCVEHLGANVVLIPNEISPVLSVKRGSARVDDRFLCSLVASLVRYSSECFVLREYCSAEDVRSVVACLDLLVGSRFHTLVFALSAGVPLIALSWAHKYAGLLQQFCLEDSFCHCREFREGSILELLDRAWGHRERTAQSIRAVLPNIISQVDAVFDRVAEILQPTASPRRV